jgi:hypothetical protein
MHGAGAGGNASPKKSARFADTGASDDGHSMFGGKSARSDSATSGVSKFKDLHRGTDDEWDSSPQKSGKVGAGASLGCRRPIGCILQYVLNQYVTAVFLLPSWLFLRSWFCV